VAEEQQPYLRVVRGDATAEEVAALVTSLMTVAAARSRAAEGSKRAPVRNQWNAPARRVRAALRPSPGGWRGSALPR
jgi:Acyl-CoA carboxylase epsilon subunit